MVLKNISNKCQIIIFVIAVFLLSSICYWHFIFAGDVDLDGDYWVFAIMWIPGTVGVICSLIFDGNLKCIYRGRMDDSSPGNGKPVTGKDLREVLDSVVHGRALEMDQFPSCGCNIKWRV